VSFQNSLKSIYRRGLGSIDLMAPVRTLSNKCPPVCVTFAMRQIGSIESESQARVFRSYLLTLGIHADLDQTRDKRWAIWVHEETRLDEARRELEQFMADPRHERYQSGAKTGAEIEKTILRDNKKFKERHVDLRTAWHKNQMMGGTLTITLIFISVAVTILQNMPGTGEFIERWLSIQQYKIVDGYIGYHERFLNDVLNGQIWRLVTPIFLHFGILHILFNMMWLRTLGGDIEAVEGTKKFALQVLTYAIAGNVLQLYFGHPSFGGMSGVNYGLFAYVWLIGKHTHEPRYQLDPVTIGLMLFWFVACWLGWIGHIANWAHTGGLILGAIWATAKLRRIPFTGIRF